MECNDKREIELFSYETNSGYVVMIEPNEKESFVYKWDNRGEYPLGWVVIKEKDKEIGRVSDKKVTRITWLDEEGK